MIVLIGWERCNTCINVKKCTSKTNLGLACADYEEIREFHKDERNEHYVRGV